MLCNLRCKSNLISIISYFNCDLCGFMASSVASVALRPLRYVRYIACVAYVALGGNFSLNIKLLNVNAEHISHDQLTYKKCRQ